MVQDIRQAELVTVSVTSPNHPDFQGVYPPARPVFFKGILGRSRGACCTQKKFLEKTVILWYQRYFAGVAGDIRFQNMAEIGKKQEKLAIL